MNPETEPVRLGGWTALVVGIGLNALLGWALDLDLRAIVATTTVMALTSIGGLEWARQNAWSPVAHFREIRAVEDHVLEDLTGEDGNVDLSAVLTVLLIVLVVVVLLRLL